MSWLLFQIAALTAAPAADTPSTCERYVGQKVTTTSFDDVIAKLPIVAPKDAYETSAGYEKRLAAAASATSQFYIIRRVSSRRNMSYDADKGVLTVYDNELGVGEVNFQYVFPSNYSKPYDDNYSSAVAFQISQTSLGHDTYEASNAYGAKVTVDREYRRVDAVWERAGKLGESPFIGPKAYTPIAKLPVSAAVAKDLIELGSSALLIVPKPPYSKMGSYSNGPTFARPKEKVDEIHVLIADVQCGFLLDGSDTVSVAFTVR